MSGDGLGDLIGPVSVGEVMERCGVRFGTSGARGLVRDMTDRVCYVYTAGFIQCLKGAPGRVVLAGDLRLSTPRIMAAVARAASDAGLEVVNCGAVPTPALAGLAMSEGAPGIMVTGSHIPDDRNGIKYYTASGEILKSDEDAIRGQRVHVPDGVFDANGAFTRAVELPSAGDAAARWYRRRFADFFPSRCLDGLRVGVYQHSSVTRDLAVDILSALGAEVVALERSDSFVPVDTEAIHPRDVALGRQWAGQGGLDALVSTDGDGDRPLVSDETGEWLRGDVAGVLCAAYLEADVVVTPVSSNTAAERSGLFSRVERTRIGSPYVVERMEQAVGGGARRVVGYEANGGFLTASAVTLDGRTLSPLPTRDAMLVAVALLHAAKREGLAVSGLVGRLPPRYTASDRLEDFPTAVSQERMAVLRGEGGEDARERVMEAFGPGFGPVAGLDETDGLRITFTSGEIVHLRPSGNAPEFRCYTEADTPQRAAELNRRCLELMAGWRGNA